MRINRILWSLWYDPKKSEWYSLGVPKRAKEIEKHPEYPCYLGKHIYVS